MLLLHSYPFVLKLVVELPQGLNVDQVAVALFVLLLNPPIIIWIFSNILQILVSVELVREHGWLFKIALNHIGREFKRKVPLLQVVVESRPASSLHENGIIERRLRVQPNAINENLKTTLCLPTWTHDLVQICLFEVGHPEFFILRHFLDLVWRYIFEGAELFDLADFDLVVADWKVEIEAHFID